MSQLPQGSHSPFLSEVHHLQALTASEMQCLIDYASSRIRAAGMVWNRHGDSFSPTERKHFAAQLYRDLETGMLLYSSGCFRFPGIIQRPIALGMMFKSTLTGMLHLGRHASTADYETPKPIPDPVLPVYANAWWNRSMTSGLSLLGLIKAWQAQRDDFEAARRETRPLASSETVLFKSLDESLERASSSTQKAIDLIERDMALALKDVRAIEAAITETEKVCQEVLGTS
ncbi:hypothetical protein CC1G_07252 [Coprinopsis cinerea okayama7|uniref:Uncharacterized protein n=1 Tax=Coprinopsis cinerea (strain Okayama-7 / 130 / ATCC MYA-4618 / FGSC 9003) TaxID=240176 RepID=A8PD37_COPC7|nr:hypothetical protein CC1G_07252 [Coprinopsis cinerea okayama7\|eukprot:XP_001840522.2 hypothetical protein CC1G_07252 [Coprinopsis cinerea okayama7\